MMIEIHVNKAQRTGHDAEPSVRITIDLEIKSPRLRDYARETQWRKALVAEHEYDAQKLCNALVASLPGGTLDRLTLKLLEQKASVLAVSVMPSVRGRRT